MQNFKTVAYLLQGYFWLVGLGLEGGDLVEHERRDPGHHVWPVCAVLLVSFYVAYKFLEDIPCA